MRNRSGSAASSRSSSSNSRRSSLSRSSSFVSSRSRSQTSSRSDSSSRTNSRRSSSTRSKSRSTSSNSTTQKKQGARRNRRRLSDTSSDASNRSLVAPIALPQNENNTTNDPQSFSLPEDSRPFQITDPSVTPPENDVTDRSFAITPDVLLDPEKSAATLSLQNFLRTGLAMETVERKRQSGGGALLVLENNRSEYQVVLTEEKRNPGGVPLVASRISDRMFALRGLSIERRHASLVRQRLQKLYSELAVLDSVPASHFGGSGREGNSPSSVSEEKPPFVPIVPAASKGSSASRVRPMSASASFGAGTGYRPKFDMSEARLRPCKVSTKALIEGPTPPSSRCSSRSTRSTTGQRNQVPSSSTGTKRPVSSANTNVLPPSSGASGASSSSFRRKPNSHSRVKAANATGRSVESSTELSNSGLYDQRSSATSAASLYSQSSGSNRGGRRYNFSSSSQQDPVQSRQKATAA